MTAPRWQRVIEKALSEDKKANIYQLATIAHTPAGPAPRVRSLVHRGFLSPSTSSQPLLITSTDARTPKLTQLHSSSLTELTWWLPHTQEQLRISGRVHVLPSPVFHLSASGDSSAMLDGAEPLSHEKVEEIESAAQELRRRFPYESLGGGDGDKKVDWEEERKKLFEGMSGHMRASWARPVPGTKLVTKPAEEWPETLPSLHDLSKEGHENNEGTKVLVEKALRNFALVIIEPEGVDYVELGVMPNRRTRFWVEEGKWREEAVVP